MAIYVAQVSSGRDVLPYIIYFYKILGITSVIAHLVWQIKVITFRFHLLT